MKLPKLIDLLRSTLERVEQSEESEDKQAAVSKLRRSVVLTIAERELRQSADEETVTSEDSAA